MYKMRTGCAFLPTDWLSDCYPDDDFTPAGLLDFFFPGSYSLLDSVLGIDSTTPDWLLYAPTPARGPGRPPGCCSITISYHITHSLPLAVLDRTRSRARLHVFVFPRLVVRP